jgi:hypothetical protein
MAISTRQELIDYCLRRLGDPVIEINVDDQQVEDRIDDAIIKFRDYHSEGTARIYHFHQVTANDVTNKYITVPNTVIYVNKMFPVDNSFINSTNMFSFQYQFALSDYHELSTFGAGSFAYYDQMRQYLSMLDMKLNGTPQITFTRRQNRIYIWGDFADQDIKAGDYIAFEVYQVVDEQQFPDVYNTTFLKDYATALIKRQWGQNMSKFEGMQLPGGVTISGRTILEEANQEIEQLVEKMRLEHEMPPDFFVG